MIPRSFSGLGELRGSPVNELSSRLQLKIDRFVVGAFDAGFDLGFFDVEVADKDVVQFQESTVVVELLDVLKAVAVREIGEGFEAGRAPCVEVAGQNDGALVGFESFCDLRELGFKRFLWDEVDRVDVEDHELIGASLDRIQSRHHRLRSIENRLACCCQESRCVRRSHATAAHDARCDSLFVFEADDSAPPSSVIACNEFAKLLAPIAFLQSDQIR